MISKRKILLITGGITIVVILIFVISIKFIRELRIRESIEIGSDYLNEENYKEAIIEFEKVINIDERNTSIKNILNILYEYKSIDDLINANDYEKALEFIKRVEENEDSELINNLIVNAKERIEDNYDKIIENKKEYLDGYWAGDKFIMQFKKDEDSFLIFSLIDDSNIDIYYNTITNFNYNYNEEVIEIESAESLISEYSKLV